MTSPDMDISWARVALACIVVTALMALMGFVLKYLKLRGFKVPGEAGATRRLAIVEQLMLDARRRLVIVRCDQGEHLLLLGANEDVVVKSDIQNKGGRNG